MLGFTFYLLLKHLNMNLKQVRSFAFALAEDLKPFCNDLKTCNNYKIENKNKRGPAIICRPKIIANRKGSLKRVNDNFIKILEERKTFAPDIRQGINQHIELEDLTITIMPGEKSEKGHMKVLATWLIPLI